MLELRLGERVVPNGLLLQVAVGCSCGLVLGAAVLWFSPILVLGALGATGFAYLSLKRPEVLLLGIIIATASIVFEDQLPLLPIGVGSLHVPDLLLLGGLVLIVLRWLVEPEFKIVRTPLDRPLLIFYGVTLLSTLIAIHQSFVEVEAARRALRVISYYLTFFIVTNLVRERRQLNFLLNSLFLLATVVAGAMLVQSLVGDSVQLLPGRVETLTTAGTTYDDVTRIAPPGLSIVFVSFVAILCTLVLEETSLPGWLKLLQLGLLGVAVLFTFLRSYWAALVVVVFLLAFIVRGQDRQRLVGWGLVVMFLASTFLVFGVGEPKLRLGRLVTASISRLSTLGSTSTLSESSLQWRYVENEYALRQIVSHPLLGLGLGAQYRPFDSRIDYRGMLWDARGFIHNGYLRILLDSGVVGLLAAMWLSFAFLIRGFRYWRSVADQRLRGVVLGFTLVFVAVLIAAIVNSTFMQWRWTPVIGVIMGVNEVILMKFSQQELAV